MKTINVNLHMFKLIGFWYLLFENDSVKRTLWIVIDSISLVYYIGYMQIVQFIHIFFFERNLVEFIYKFVCTLTYFEGGVKFLYHWKNRHLIKKLLEVYKVDYLNCASHNLNRSYEILKKGEKLANAGILFIYFAIISTASVWSINALVQCLFFDCTELSILPTWFPFDRTEPKTKAIGYLMDFGTIFYEGFTLSVVDAFVLALFVITSCQVELLGDAIENIKTNAEMRIYGHPARINGIHNSNGQMNSVKDVPDKRLQETMDILLDACLKDHQKILRTVELLESIYSPLLLFHAAISCIIICSVGVILILPFAIPPKDQSTFDSIFKVGFKHFVYFSDATCELFLYCWIGFVIGEQTNRLHLRFYSSDWPDGTTKFRKQILLATTRASRPSNITAGKFQIVNLAFFASIMKISYSYLMVLYGFIKKLDIEEIH